MRLPLLYILALLALSACSELMAPLDASHTKLYVIPAAAYVRSCPRLDCAITAELQRGDEVASLRRKWFWVEVLQWGGVRGWMESSDLDTRPVLKRSSPAPRDQWSVPETYPHEFSW